MGCVFRLACLFVSGASALLPPLLQVEMSCTYQGRQAAGIALVHVDGGRVVDGIVGTLGDAEPDPGHILRTGQVG